MSTRIVTENSSNVRSVEYDDATQKLTVEFSSGTYDYFDVPPEKWAAIEGAATTDGASVGRVISSQIVRQHKFLKHKEGNA